jgi:hypothetical protein
MYAFDNEGVIISEEAPAEGSSPESVTNSTGHATGEEIGADHSSISHLEARLLEIEAQSVLSRKKNAELETIINLYYAEKNMAAEEESAKQCLLAKKLLEQLRGREANTRGTLGIPATVLKFGAESPIFEKSVLFEGITEDVGEDLAPQSRQVKEVQILELETQSSRILELGVKEEETPSLQARAQKLELRVSELREIVAGTDPRQSVGENGCYRTEWSELFAAEAEIRNIRVQYLREKRDIEASTAKQKQDADVAGRQALKEQKSLAAANRVEAKKQRESEQLARELEASAAREKGLRENIPGLRTGCPHWSGEAMYGMQDLMSITTQEDIDRVLGEIPKYVAALANLVGTGEPIVFDHHELTEYEKVFANTFNRYLAMTSDPVVDSLVERLQKLYSTHHANGNLALAKYESCSMYWYLCSKTLDAYQLNRIIVAEAPLIRQSGFGIRPKYIVENNWNFEELTYAQLKQRAVEALISDQVDQDDGTAAIGLSSDVEVSSQLEPTSEFRKETNFDEASKVQQPSQISSVDTISMEPLNLDTTTGPSIGVLPESSNVYPTNGSDLEVSGKWNVLRGGNCVSHTYQVLVARDLRDLKLEVQNPPISEFGQVEDELGIRLFKEKDRMDDQADNSKYIELPSEIEISSRLEPISELRKETNFDDASGVTQKQHEIFSVYCRSKVA